MFMDIDYFKVILFLIEMQFHEKIYASNISNTRE